MNNNISYVAIGILIPFLGTTVGSALVFLLKNKIRPNIQKMLLGFAAGVMMAASVWSLLIPAINMAESQGKIAWIPTSIGFMIGVITLIIINKLVEYFEEKNATANSSHTKKSVKEKIKSTTMLVLAVTLHNIPEGMAVGVVFAGLLQGGAGITLASSIALAIGIAIQNIPEGAIISIPVRASGKSKFKSFMYGTLSGIVEPIGAVITVLLTKIVVPILPYILSFAAGAMIYVVSSELIPEAQEDKDTSVATVGVAVGFVIMMLLDIALG
jgi:ZIP family zinc transporter